jgi:hypothetical protein
VGSSVQSVIEACPAGVGTVDGRRACDTGVVGFVSFDRLVGVSLDVGNVGGLVGGIDGSGGCLMVVAV